MKKVVIAALVAAVIVFVYQALSHMVFPTHKKEMKYTQNQDAVLAALSTGLAEEGSYLIPNLPFGSTPAECEAMHKSIIGKPWAIIQYHKAMSGSMGPQMGVGFLLNLLAAFILAWLIFKLKDKLPGFGPKLIFIGMVVVFMILQEPLMRANWWEQAWHSLQGDVIDHIVGWALGGTFMAWYLGKKQRA